MIRKLTYTVLSFLLVFLTGCSYDEPFYPERGNDGANLTVMVPSVALARESGKTRGDGMSTRAGNATASSELLEKEATMTKLYLAAFYTPEGSSTRKHFFYELTPEMGVAVDGIYRSFSFNVEEGDYTLYLMANLEPGETLKANLSNSEYGDVTSLENEVRDLQKSYSSGSMPALPVNNDPSKPGLPMAGKKVVSVTKGASTEAIIPLEFLCAKVRLTLIHEDSLGLTGGHVTQLSASNLYSPSNFFEGGRGAQYTGSGSPFNITGDAAAVSGHFELTSNIKGKDIATLAGTYSSSSADPIENLGSAITDFSDCKENVYQGVIYLPESPEITDISKSTKVNATFSTNADGTGTKTYAFAIGCNKDSDAINPNESATTNSRVKRGHFYDIVARLKGGDIEVYYSVTDWEVDDLTMEGAGYSHLYLAKTVIDQVSGSEVERIPYQTDAPSLTFESPTMKVGENDVPIFSMRENKEEGVIEVSLGSGVALGQSVPEDKRYFWVKAGTIRKQVKVTSVDTQAFVRLTPAERHLYIAQVINSQSYPLWFEYSTNMDNLTLTLPGADYKNTNTSRGKDNISVRIYTGTEDENSPYSEESRMPSASSENIVISGLAKLTGVTEDATKSGLICIMVKEPSDQSAFGQEISGKITANGTCNATGVSAISTSATFTINPTPSKYVIHFKAIKSKADGTLDSTFSPWTIPHCYVYQPLVVTCKHSSHMDEDVYVMDSRSDDKDKERLNWLEYSFTGMAVFKGWTSELGAIADFNTQQPTTVYQGGAPILAYKKWGGDAGTLSSDQYFLNIDLIPEFRKKVMDAYNSNPRKVNCEQCGEGKNIRPTWPGISMIKETREEVGEDGWWRIELPMIAEPGLALVMFACSHQNDTEKGYRYPDSSIPGIPLPNYASKEAWFLYDANPDVQDQLAFSDQRRESYSGAIENREGDWVTVAFRAPADAGDNGINSYLKVSGDASDRDNKVIIGPKGVKYAGQIRGYYYWTTQIFVDKDMNKTVTDYIKTYQFGSNDSDTSGSVINWSANGHKEETDGDTKKLYGNCSHLYTIWTNNTTTAPTPPNYVVIYWPTSFANSTSMYMWKDGYQPLGAFPGTASKTVSSNSNRWVWAKQSMFVNRSVPTLSDGYMYILNPNSSNNQGQNMGLIDDNAEIMTANVVPEAIVNEVPGTITGVIYVKKR